jgi:riboflavin kinase, archaea type
LSRRVAGWDTAVQRRIHGVIFSDLGQASLFMALDWVQEALRRILGFVPYPATLNVRPSTAQDARFWHEVQREVASVPLASDEGGFCSAQLYFVSIAVLANPDKAVNAAVLVPAVTDYPKDKIEIVAPVRLKEALGVKDGDCLLVEFND